MNELAQRLKGNERRYQEVVSSGLRSKFDSLYFGLTDVSAVKLTDAFLECSVIATGKNKQYFIIYKPFPIWCYLAA